MFSILTAKTISVDDILGKHEHEDKATIIEYFDFMTQNELGFYCSEEDVFLFRDLQLDYLSPSTITNAILDFNEVSNYDYQYVVRVLEGLGCKDVQLRFFSPIPLDDLEAYLSCFERSSIKSIELLLPYSREIDEKVESVLSLNLRVTSFVFWGAPESKTLTHGKDFFSKIAYTKEKLDSSLHCGRISSTVFSLNIESFTEAVNYNSCLNRKLGIDVHGNIKNCPSQSSSYGNVAYSDVKEIVMSDLFRGVWGLKKDSVEKCRDCEFRYICSDCRVYVEDPTNPYSKPLKCGYDPYQGIWEEWSTNPLKQKAIEYYFGKDHLPAS